MSLEFYLLNVKKEVQRSLVFVFVGPMTRTAQTVQLLHLQMAPDTRLFQNWAWKLKRSLDVKH